MAEPLHGKITIEGLTSSTPMTLSFITDEDGIVWGETGSDVVVEKVALYRVTYERSA